MGTRLVYRSYGGENRKSRPGYYSKLLALASFVRAADAADLDIVFVNDGPIPPDRMALMARRGQVVHVANGPAGMRTSYLTGLLQATERRWGDDDVAYFCEDDYLHTVDAFATLAAAAEQLPEVAYFTLHGTSERDPAVDFPHGWQPRQDLSAAGISWTNIPSTTSTFGGRVGAVKQDMGIFRQCMRPFRRTFLDHETCLLYQGYPPYNLVEIFTGMPDRWATDVASMAKTAVMVPFRVGMNARALTRRRRPHLLYTSEPNLACHLEDDVISPGVDWPSVAEETREWAAEAGHPIAGHGQG